MRAHEAGALHGSLGTRGPDWLETPVNVNAIHRPLWPSTVTRGDDGAFRFEMCRGVFVWQVRAHAPLLLTTMFAPPPLPLPTRGRGEWS